MTRTWHNEPWVKLYKRIDAKWLRLSATARGLADELLKYADGDGFLLALGKDEGAHAAVADLMAPKAWERKNQERAALELFTDGYLVEVAGRVSIRNYQAAQERLSPATVRKRRQRDRERDNERDSHAFEGVTGSVTDDVTVTKAVTGQSPGNETRRDEEAHPARTRAIPRGGLGATWFRCAGNLATDGLLELADLAERSAATVDEAPGPLLERAIGEYLAYRGTCSAGRVPSLTPRKLVERWADVWERMYPPAPPSTVVAFPSDADPGPRRSFL